VRNLERQPSEQEGDDSANRGNQKIRAH
jgi:hypothetical protein